jgi:predicted TIM-barrel fold metal-dependent hydrolase
MIIDTHTHFYDPTRPQGVPWPPADNKLLYRTVQPTHHRALAAPQGVTGTVVVEASLWLEDNQYLLDLAARDSWIVGVVGNVASGRPEFGAELDRFAANPLFRGIRVRGTNPFDDVEKGSFLADMARLAALDLEADVLIRQQHVDGLVALAEHVPDLRIVVDHICHMPIDGQPVPAEWLDAYARLAEPPNVYLKVSAVMEQSTVQPAPADLGFYMPALNALWNAFGEDRVIYGSNWPVCERAGTFEQSIRIVKDYVRGKGQAAWEKYFWQNGQVAYKWVTR